MKVDDKVIFVIGNDGSGKSTFIKSLIRDKDGEAQNLIIRHYYDNRIRSIFRLFFISSKSNISKALPKKTNTTSSGKSIVILIGYCLYTVLNTLLIRLTSRYYSKYQLVYDRSFIDELVSIEVFKNLQFPKLFMKIVLGLLNDVCFIYLNANSQTKFQRIVDKDIVFEDYLKKERRYSELMKLLRDSKRIKLLEINTENDKSILENSETRR